MSQFGRLTSQEQDLIAQQGLRVTLRKGDYFVEPGSGAQRIGFVEAGVLRIYNSTAAGTDITRYFIEERHPLLEVREPDCEDPATPCLVQAITACELVVFTAQQWQSLAEVIPSWNAIVHNIMAHELREKVARIVPMVNQDAAARYRSFLVQYPRLANRVPLAYLASYLGMTPSSLSRIRKAIR